MFVSQKYKKFTSVFIFISYFFLALAYIHPGENFFLKNSRVEVLSNGVDPVTFPYQFDFLIRHFKERPTDFLYGAVLNPHMDVPYGVSIWEPMLERLELIFLAPFIPIEQMSTALALMSMTLNGFFMFLLGRSLHVSTTLSWGMGLAWAFNPYTRAAAKIFMGLVGIFHLPLVFLALILISNGKRFQLFIASFLLLIISWMPHYYVVVLTFFLPLLFLFSWKLRPKDSNKFKYILILVGCSLPAIMWLLFSLLRPLPSDIQRSVSAFPKTGETKVERHPFLYTFSASPIDYLTGDIGLGDKDINPLRHVLSKEVIENDYEGQHTHDRAVGVRWTLLILGLFAIILVKRRPDFFIKEDRWLIIFFAFFGLVSFWLALPPDLPFEGAGGSLLIYKVIPQIRIPSRAGIGVAFAAILLSGLLLKNLLSHTSKRRKAIIQLSFLALIFLELPPFFQEMPTAKISPPYRSLTTPKACGWGLKFPYVSLLNEPLTYFNLLQRMRGSSCGIINSSVANEVDSKMTRLLSEKNLVTFANCVPLAWIVLDNPQICDQLGRTWKEDGVCISDDVSIMPKRSLEECLNILDTP